MRNTKKRINFDEPACNGAGGLNVHGLEVSMTDDYCVHLQPLTNRGNVDAARELAIPPDALEEVIQALEVMRERQQETAQTARKVKP